MCMRKNDVIGQGSGIVSLAAWYAISQHFQLLIPSPVSFVYLFTSSHFSLPGTLTHMCIHPHTHTHNYAHAHTHKATANQLKTQHKRQPNTEYTKQNVLQFTRAKVQQTKFDD